jgi:hypothetical protein
VVDEPGRLIRQLETAVALPAGTEKRFTGYGITAFVPESPGFSHRYQFMAVTSTNASQSTLVYVISPRSLA